MPIGLVSEVQLGPALVAGWLMLDILQTLYSAICTAHAYFVSSNLLITVIKA